MAFLKKSDYLLLLEKENADVAIRYKDKIRIIQCVDPFCLTVEETSTVLEDFPLITPFEIITYLVLTHSFYTSIQMNNKSLTAYKYFEAGFVHDCQAKNIGNHIVVLGKVKHSQRMNESSLKVWIICQIDGAVNSAHCTCMAGLSEVCSHVAAVLYAVEFIKKSESNTSCTDIKAKWITPKLVNVPIVKLREMHLKRPSVQAKAPARASTSKTSGDEELLQQQSLRVSSTSQTHVFSALNNKEVEALLNQIKEIDDDAVLLRVVEPFCSEISGEMYSQELPNVLPNVYKIYKKEHEILSYKDLLSMAQEINETISDDQRQNILLATLEQNKSAEWYNQRSGRITASIFKRVCHTSIEKPSLSLIKSICYPLDNHFKSKATEWGLHNEAKALEQYKCCQLKMHTNLKVEKVGLCVDEDNSFLAASPDSIVSCFCCGNGCVEVKCPYTLKYMELNEFSMKKKSFLENKNDKMSLKHNHAYYYQVQLQIKLTKSLYCDFVVCCHQQTNYKSLVCHQKFSSMREFFMMKTFGYKTTPKPTIFTNK